MRATSPVLCLIAALYTSVRGLLSPDMSARMSYTALQLASATAE